MPRASLEHRLNTRIDTAMAIYLVAFAVALGLFLARGATRQFDRTLLTRAESIVHIARQELAESGDSGALVPHFEGLDLGEFAIWLSDGTLVGSIDSLDALDIQIEKPISDTPHFADLELPDGRPGRKVEIDFVPRGQGGHEMLPSQVAIGSGVTTATLVVAESREALDRRILEITVAVVAGCALLLVSLALLVHSSLRRGLAPVIGLRRQVERLGPRGSVHRVSLSNPPAELAPVVAGINELLERQRSVAAAASSRGTDDIAKAS